MGKELKNCEPYVLAAIGPAIYAIYWKMMESKGLPVHSEDMQFFQAWMLCMILLYRYTRPLDDKNIGLLSCARLTATAWMIIIGAPLFIYGSLYPRIILEIFGVDSLESNKFLLIHLIIIYFISLLAIIMMDTNVTRLQNESSPCKVESVHYINTLLSIY